MMKKYFFIPLLTLLTLFASCSSKEARISGQLVGAGERKIYLERILPAEQRIIDSTTTNQKGEFRFNVKLPKGQTTIFNLRSDGDRIPLLISAGESAKILSVGGLGRNYTVSGSDGSERMRLFKRLLSEGAYSLDSIVKLYATQPSIVSQQDFSSVYTSKYYSIKRKHIEFIVTDPGSLVSLYALYQRLPNDANLLSEEMDIVYFRLVADSTSRLYPSSQYVMALQNQIVLMEAEQRVIETLNRQISEQASVDFPDLMLSDMYGSKHRLSLLKDKVILLDFWSATQIESTSLNAELKALYEELNGDGFEVYQVSVDESKALWIASVQKQRLKWFSVHDSQQVATQLYGIRSVPSNFLIDRNGNIVDKTYMEMNSTLG